MSAAAWRALLDALGEIDHQAQAAATARALGHGAPASETPGEPDPVAVLHARVNQRLDPLFALLEHELGDLVTAQVRLPLLVVLDERILTRLGAANALSWPLLQRELLPAGDGGQVFFERLDRLLAQSSTPGFVLELHWYCLRTGYTGRFYDNPDAIAGYRRQLAERITPSPEATAQGQAAQDTATERVPLSSLRATGRGAVLAYYALTLCFIVLLPFLLRYLTNS